MRGNVNVVTLYNLQTQPEQTLNSSLSVCLIVGGHSAVPTAVMWTLPVCHTGQMWFILNQPLCKALWKWKHCSLNPGEHGKISAQSIWKKPLLFHFEMNSGAV